MTGERTVHHVTCLGCGCGCDDVTVTISDGRIVAAAPICPLGQAWFGDGRVPEEIRLRGQAATLDQAIDAAASELAAARGRCLVYLGYNLTSQAQRAALALADLLQGTVDGSTSETAAIGLLSAQRRGRAAATLGEIRNRADVLLFWGVDPTERYPRFLSRYALDPAGTHVPGGRKGRVVIAVHVGADRAVAGADLELEIAPDHEIEALSLMRSLILGRALSGSPPTTAAATEIAGRLAGAGYAVVVHDAEPTAERRNPLRAEALIALVQVLNGPTRSALCTLRPGGNCIGAESVLTWQSGFPFAVDYGRGFPRYTPGHRGLTRLAAGGVRAVLVAGSSPGAGGLTSSGTPSVVIGPKASEASYQPLVAIDTGVAGIHERGTAYRMDEVPLRLRPPMESVRSAAEVLARLHDAVRKKLAGPRA